MTRYWKNEAGGGGVGDIFFQKGELCIPYTAYVHVYICVYTVYTVCKWHLRVFSLTQLFSFRPVRKEHKRKKVFFPEGKNVINYERW